MGGKEWTSVSRLSVVLQTGQQAASMRGVSSREIGVVVSIQPTDSDGNPAPQEFSDLYKSVSIIDYVDESEVSKEPGDWYYQKEEEFKGTNGNGTQQIRFIVNWTENPKLHTRSFGVKVQIATGPPAIVCHSSLNGIYHSSVLISTL